MKSISLSFFFLILLQSSLFSQNSKQGNLFEEGLIQFEKENWEAASQFFSEWLALHPRDAQAFWLRGQAFEQLANYQMANSDFSNALELNPEQGEIYFARGRVRHLLGQFEAAMQDYDSFIQSEPTETTQVIFRKEPGDTGYSKPMTVQNRNPAQIYYHMGMTSLELEEYDQAISYFDESIKFNSEEPNFYAERGRAYSKLGENNLALESFEIALEMDPDNILARQGIALVKTGGDEDLIQNLTEVIEDSIANSQTYKQRGFYRMNNEDLEGALADFSQALILEENDIETLYYRGKVYAKLKEWKAAESDFSKAIEFDPQNPELFLSRGQSRYQAEAFEEALADFTIFVSLDPENPSSYYHRGIAYQRLKKPDLACADLAKASELGMDQAKAVWEKICGNQVN